MKALVVAGARPNFMKVAPILRALADGGHEGVLVHTGQHYDAQMSDAFFRDLDLPDPDFHLEVGSASHAGRLPASWRRSSPSCARYVLTGTPGPHATNNRKSSKDTDR